MAWFPVILAAVVARPRQPLCCLLPSHPLAGASPRATLFNSKRRFLITNSCLFFGLVFTVSALGFANPMQVITKRAFLAVSA